MHGGTNLGCTAAKKGHLHKPATRMGRQLRQRGGQRKGEGGGHTVAGNLHVMSFGSPHYLCPPAPLQITLQTTGASVPDVFFGGRLSNSRV